MSTVRHIAVGAFVVRTVYELTCGEPDSGGAPVALVAERLGCEDALVESLLGVAETEGLVRRTEAGRVAVTPLGCLVVELEGHPRPPRPRHGRAPARG